MICFVCRGVATAHIIRGLNSQKGPGGWGRICVPCAIRHDLDGELLSPPGDAGLAELWLAHRSNKDSQP